MKDRSYSIGKANAILPLTGAGHGGNGGRGSSQNTVGVPFGDVFQPSSRGCVGGQGRSSNTGGNAGGVVYVTVTDTLRLDGSITCNGGAGSNYGGGGSGGSVHLVVSKLKVRWRKSITQLIRRTVMAF